jgi:hypothetical protein
LARTLTPAKRDPVYASLLGEWQGTLEVRDARDRARRLRKPARVEVRPAPRGEALELRMRTADSASVDLLRLNAALTAAERKWGDEAVLHSYGVHVTDSSSGNAPLTIVLENEQLVNEILSTVRETIAITPGAIVITRQLRPFGGVEFETASTYTLRRVG